MHGASVAADLLGQQSRAVALTSGEVSFLTIEATAPTHGGKSWARSALPAFDAAAIFRSAMVGLLPPMIPQESWTQRG